MKNVEKGEDKENYEVKNCPLIINSDYITNDAQPELKIENREENVFYFNTLIYKDSLKISYDIKKISINSFVSLNFNCKDAPFLINIFYNNNNNEKSLLSKNIINSNYIYIWIQNFY